MLELESVVTFKWKSPRAYRSTFTSRHVNVLRRCFAQHYPRPHRFICITDDPQGLDADIEYVPMWDTFTKLQNPTWPTGPNCYPRLVTFGEDFERIAGKRFICLDIDIVVRKNIESLIDRPEDFVIWGTGNARIPYCASMYMMTAGAKKEVLEKFDPLTSPRLSNAAGYRGSDQAWINYCLGRDIPTWKRKDGVYSYRDDLLKSVRWAKRPPEDARVVIFHGKPDPWDHQARLRSPWLQEVFA